MAAPENLSHQDSGSKSGSNPKIDDLDIPIALRKGTRTCTKHPISDFLGYAHLSRPMQCFITHLAGTEVPRTIQETLKSTEWSKAANEEMRALKLNDT